MAKKPSATSDLEVAAVAAANRTVFIDTSFDTHFAMVLSDPDTVSDLKRKIENEHTLCFTNVGNIVVHALKVKRKGHLYHLSDSMFVKDAFDGANKNWFLSVDASVVEKKNDENQLVHNPDSHNLLTCYGILHDTSANGVHLPLDAAKGKRKFEDKVGNQHLREENIDTGKDISHSLTNNSSTRRTKRRKKSKSKLDQVGAADPSSGRVITTGEELDTISVPRLDENGVKHYNIVLNTGEHVLSSEDEYDSDAPEGEATPTATPLRNSKDHYPVEVEGNHPVVTESHDDQPTDIRVSGQDNIGNDQAERAEKQGALSKREEYLETQSKKHGDLLLDIGVSGQKIIGSSPAGRAEEQGALSKNNGSFKTLLKKHDNQPLSTGVSGQGNTGTGQAERAEEQGALSKRTGSAKMQAKKYDDLPLDSGVSGKENERAEEQGALLRTGSAKMQAKKYDDLPLDSGVSGKDNERAEEQGALSKRTGSVKMQAKKLDDLPVDSGVSGKENERAEEQEALSKRMGSAKMQAKKHDDLPLDSGVSGTENERGEEQGALSKRMGSAKMQAKKHDDLPLDSGVSGKENERAEEQGALSKRTGSAKMQAKKHDDLPLDSGVSGKENERAEEQGALSKRTGSGKMQVKKHDDLPLDSGVSGKENERAEEQGALSKRMGSGKMQAKKHDDLPLDSGVSGKENIGSGQAGRAEEQGSLSKKKDSLKTQSKNSDNIPTDIGVSGQENVGSDQTDRADEPGALSKKKDSFKMELKKHNDIPNEIAFPGKENIESGRAEKAEEQGALFKRKDSLDTQLKRLNATADLVGENGTVEPADSGKKRKRTRKPKDLVSKVVTASDREHVGGSEINISAEPLGAKHDELASNRARNEASISSQPNGKEELRSNAESTIREKENDSITGNTVKNMQQTSKNQENAENVEEQVGKRSKKKQKSSAKNIPDLPSEYRSVVHQISQPPADNKCQVVTSSDTKSKGKLKKTAAKDHLNEGKMESENLGVQKELVPAQSNSVLAKSTKVQSNSLDHRNEGNAGEADLIDNPPASADKANKEKEISGEKSWPDIVTSSGVLVDKKVGANKAAKTPKAKKNIEKPDIQSDRVSIDIQSSVKSNKKQGIEGKSPAGKSSTTLLQGSSLSKDKPDQSAVTKKNIEKPDIQSDQVSSDSQRSVKSNKKQGIERKPPAGKSSATPLQGSPLSKDKPDQSAVQPKKNLQKSSRNKAKAPPSDVSDKLISTPKKAKTQNAVCVSGTNTHSGKTAGLASVSNSHMESSRKTISKDVAANKHQPGVDSDRASNAKTASKSDGKIVDREPGKKSIATPGKVFKDDDSVETSEDEEVDDSDASSKTPSDFLQSSDYSDGESNANFNSPCKGSTTSDRTKSGGRSTKKSCSGAKNMTFNSILKSSSRYKKAKLTASQLQLEDESQPDEFVPDSLAIE